MTPINPDKILSRLEAGTLIRHEWGDGYKRACLLAAIHPPCATEQDAAVCPAELMPAWLAELTPRIDDDGTDAAWPAMIRRYAAVAARWRVLDDLAWRRCLAVTMIECLAIAAPHDPSGSCDHVSALWARVLTGDEPTPEEWAAAVTAARTARTAARTAEAWTAEAAVTAAWTAVTAAWTAGAAVTAAVTAARTARTAAWDRITATCLGAIEAECERAEVQS